MERFWMGGVLAEDLQEIRNDLAAVSEGGFWAVLGTFEGEWTCARFSKISRIGFAKSTGNLKLSNWNSSIDRDKYLKYVESIREEIAKGTFYQVNACRILSAEIAGGTAASIFPKILEKNPAPYAALFELPGFELVSASPERFISIHDGVIKSSPIKGTSPNREFKDKDRSENLMIVDLMRNDLGKICETGSITTPRINGIEAHPGLFHLVSDITGKVRTDIGIAQVIDELMPPGSVSGAPKSSALQMIKTWEGARGPYCGTFGWVENGNCELAVSIRTFWRDGETLKFGTGAGITWGSDAGAEWEETELKASRLISIASDQS
jgi:para-aminobenzoate synthetase component 1